MSATHFSGPVALGSGAYESLTASKVLTAKDNGKLFGLNLAGGFAITLPLLAQVSTGWKVRFRVETTPASNYDIDADAGDVASIVGGFTASDGTTVASATELGGADSIGFLGASSGIGDFIDIETNGINWFASGRSSNPASLAFFVI